MYRLGNEQWSVGGKWFLVGTQLATVQKLKRGEVVWATRAGGRDGGREGRGRERRKRE